MTGTGESNDTRRHSPDHRSDRKDGAESPFQSQAVLLGLDMKPDSPGASALDASSGYLKWSQARWPIGMLLLPCKQPSEGELGLGALPYTSLWRVMHRGVDVI